jgi:molybdate transport system substrate-binding protein
MRLASAPGRAAVIAAAVALGLVGLAAYLVLDGGSGSGQQPLTVLAASSLTEALPAIDPAPRYSFAGSNALAAQIESGVPADVFASADPAIAERLRVRGLVERPEQFASNRLVVVVPESNPAGIESVRDLARPGVRVALAAPAVPVGGYALEALRALGLVEPVLANVVSTESDVRAVLAKVAVGQADAGVVYATDARSLGDEVRAIAFPDRVQPPVAYAIAVVARSEQPEAARAYVRRVLSDAGQARLAAAGFVPAR